MKGLNISYRSRGLGFLFLLCFMFILIGSQKAQGHSSFDLIESPTKYDGKRVVYSGEVIGEVMIRGDYAWVNLYDGKAAIGVWLDKNLTRDIVYTGSYKAIGDWLEVEGIFNRACLEHGGDLDIHAYALRKIKGGRAVFHRLNPQKLKVALILFVGLCLSLILKRLPKG